MPTIIPARRDSIQVIGRAAAILRALRERDGASLGDLARDLALPRSTVQRIVSALAEEQLVSVSGARGGIRLGPAVLALAGGEPDMVEIAHPHLKALAAETGETVDLARLRGHQLVFIDQIAGSQRLRAVSAVGERFPLHATANGKAVLAQLDDQKLAALMAAGLPNLTTNTLSDERRLRREITTIRRAGFALDREEHTLGISAVGAALQGPSGIFYAISVPMPTIRFERQKAAVAEALLRTVAAIRKALAPAVA